MKALNLTTALLLGTAVCFAQFRNETQLYVSPGEEVHVFEDMTNENQMRIGEGGLLYVDGNLVNNNIMGFENTASLLRGSVGNDGTGSGTYYVHRLGSSGQVYNYWSSPMQAAAGIPGTYSHYFDPNTGTESFDDDQDPDPGWVLYNGVMIPGRGYASMNGGQAVFQGQVNNGNVNVPLVYHPYIPGNTAAGTPRNLCGNPYPSAISCLDLVTQNTDVSGAIYFWDDDLSGGGNYSYSDYAVWNGTGSLGTGAGTSPPNGYIASGQGFMIRALYAGASLNFNNSMRVAGNNGQFFREASNNDSRLWLSLSNEELFNQTLFAILDDATDGEDRLYDADKFRGNQGIALAQVLNGQDYAIQALGHGYEERVVPLMAYVAEAGVYTFSADSLQGFEEYPLVLHDNQLNTSFPLYEGAEYSFYITPEDEYGRFQLGVGYQPNGIVQEEVESGLTAYFSNGLGIINQGNSFVADEVLLLDAQGRMVLRRTGFTMNQGNNSIPLQVSTGVYILRVREGEKEQSMKLIAR